MRKEQFIVQIDKLIIRVQDKNNSVFILAPLVQAIYRKITGEENFSIGKHLPTDLSDGYQNVRREPMVQLLEGLKEQIDFFFLDGEITEESRTPIGFRNKE